MSSPVQPGPGSSGQLFNTSDNNSGSEENRKAPDRKQLPGSNDDYPTASSKPVRKRNVSIDDRASKLCRTRSDSFSGMYTWSHPTQLSRSSSIDSIKELYSDPFDTDFSGSDSETSVPFKTVSVKDDEQTMTVAMSAKRAQLLSELATGLSSDVDLSKEYEAMVNRVKSYSASSAILKQPDQWPEQEIISLCQEAIDYTRTQKLAEPTHSRDPRWPSLPSDEMTASDKTYIHEMVVGQNCYIA